MNFLKWTLLTSFLILSLFGIIILQSSAKVITTKQISLFETKPKLIDENLIGKWGLTQGEKNNWKLYQLNRVEFSGFEFTSLGQMIYIISYDKVNWNQTESVEYIDYARNYKLKINGFTEIDHYEILKNRLKIFDSSGGKHFFIKLD